MRFDVLCSIAGLDPELFFLHLDPIISSTTNPRRSTITCIIIKYARFMGGSQTEYRGFRICFVVCFIGYFDE